jgi:hypothetical protein
MENDHNPIIATLQGSIVPSTPLGVALMVFAYLFSYYPMLAMLACHLITLPITCSTLECFSTIFFYLLQTTSTPNHYLSLVGVHFSLHALD